MKRNKIIVFLVIWVVAITMIIMYNNETYAAENTQTIENGTYYITSALNESYALDIPYGSKDDCANVQLWSFNKGENQKFDVKYLYDGYYVITSSTSGKALDVYENKKEPETNIVQFKENDGDNQTWLIKSAGNGYYYIVSKSSGLNIDVYGGNAQDGANIQIYTGHGDKGQQFKFEPVTTPPIIEDGKYYIKSALDENYTLDIPNGSIENEANVQLWEYNAGLNQQFDVEYLKNGCYIIKNAKSGKALDVYENRKTPETNIEQYELNNKENQCWIIKEAENGYYYITSESAELNMDVYGGKAKNGANIQIYSNHYGIGQQFKFEPVDNEKDENKNSNTDEEKKEEEPKKETEPVKLKGSKIIEDGIYIIKSALNEELVLDVSGASTINEANIALWTDNSGTNQRFYIKYNDDGYYTIVNCNSNKALDIYYGKKDIETNIQQYEIHGGDSQKWIIKSAENGNYYFIAQNSGLYMDVYGGKAQNGSNIQIYTGHGDKGQQFKLEMTGLKTVDNGIYNIKSAINSNMVLDIYDNSYNDTANVILWTKTGGNNQKFKFIYNNRGYYTIKAMHSRKVLDIAWGGTPGANVQQYKANNGKNQRWIVEKDGETYKFKSIDNGVYLNVENNIANAGQNINVEIKRNIEGQNFLLEEVQNTTYVDNSKYPGYLDRINSLLAEYPNWDIEFLYTGLTFDEAVNGEYAIRKRNLVPQSYGAYSAWVADDDKTLYDTGWYPASRKAIAYQMDPRNFLNSTGIFQFKDVNQFNDNAVTIDNLNERVYDTFLEGYGSDIYYACKNTNVDPYYVVARIMQEGGGSTLKMVRNEGTYYNPFNIGASGDGTENVITNAYYSAKSRGWNTMQKAIEGGIAFLKSNFLEDYQNTLYTNKFDIDKRHGGSLYAHQYMQNLFAAQGEANFLKGYYQKEGTLNSDFTFIIPLYENMPSYASPNPTISYSTICNFSAVIKTSDGSGCNVRSGPGTSYNSLGAYIDGTVLNVIDNVTYKNTNGYDWYKIVLPSGTQGYIPSKFLSY